VKQQREQAAAEQRLLEELDAQHQKRLREMQDDYQRRQGEIRTKAAAQIDAAAPDKKDAIMKQARAEEEKMRQAQGAEQARQEGDLKRRIEEKKKRRQRDLQSKHQEEYKSEYSALKKEKDQFRKEATIAAEKEKIKEAVASGEVDGDQAQEAAETIMYRRHREEILKLDQELKKEGRDRLDKATEITRQAYEANIDRVEEQQDKELAQIARMENAADRARAEQKLAENVEKAKRDLKALLEEETARQKETIDDDNELTAAQRRMDLKIRHLAEIDEATSSFGKPEDVLKSKRQTRAKQEATRMAEELAAFKSGLEKDYEEQRLQAEREKDEARRKLREQQERDKQAFDEEMRAEEERARIEREKWEKARDEKKADFEEAERAAKKAAREARSKGKGGEDEAQRILSEFEREKGAMEAQLASEKESQEQQRKRLLEEKRSRRQKMENKHQQQSASLNAAATSAPVAPVAPVQEEAKEAKPIDIKDVKPMTRVESILKRKVMAAQSQGALEEWVKAIVEAVHNPLSSKLDRIEAKIDQLLTR